MPDASSLMTMQQIRYLYNLQKANVTANYDSTATYEIGDYCLYLGILYRCISTISTAEDFDSSHWVSTNVDAELDRIEASVYTKSQTYSKSEAVAKVDIVNNLTNGGTTVPLSAEMGKQIRNTFNVVGSSVPINNRTVANGTFVTMATFTPDENGSYLIIANMGYGSDTNGIRILLVDTTETSSNTTSNSVLVVGRSMLQRVSIYGLTTNDTVYIRAYQNSGGDLTVGGSYRVLRLK